MLVEPAGNIQHFGDVVAGAAADAVGLLRDAHELVHRITGIGDLPYTLNSPTDLMSVNHNPNFSKLFINNSLSLTQSEGLQLQKKCLEKHPE